LGPPKAAGFASLQAEPNMPPLQTSPRYMLYRGLLRAWRPIQQGCVFDIPQKIMPRGGFNRWKCRNCHFGKLTLCILSILKDIAK